MPSVRERELRSEIGYLGTILGDTISDFAGEEALAIVEQLRRLAWDRRIGRENADQEMTGRIASLSAPQLKLLTRAFSVFLDLLNVVEDRRRVHVLANRAREAYPNARGESIRAAIGELKQSGSSASDVQQLLDRLHIELVFTAHPTDAKRRSVRTKLTAIRRLMSQLDEDLLPEQRDRTQVELRGEIAKLWQTDFVRPWRPTVMQEVGRGLSIKPVLWKEVPCIADELRRAVRENYGDDVQPHRPAVTFGSWIGGDRDGHPGVTAKVTEETIQWLRREAIAFHLRTCDGLFGSLSLSERQIQLSGELQSWLTAATKRHPSLADSISGLPPGELCRRFLAVIRWRLERTEALEAVDHASTGEARSAAIDDGAYASACELLDDFNVLAHAIGQTPGNRHLMSELEAWRAQIETFGFHLARLDVRQNAKVYTEVINELLIATHLCETPESLDETQRSAVLEQSLLKPWSIDESSLAPMTRETLAMFRTLHRITDAYSLATIGAHVISMTAAPSDVLSVLWLWNQTAGADPAHETLTKMGPPIAPLLETISDLEHGPAILRGMLEIASYREYLRRHGDQQMIMLGYSDSTKDGGYLAACWSLYTAQKRLVDVAAEYDVELTFFHGRGGSLGRGGGPAARSILSLPQGTFKGSLRLTEQGEVLADRYDDPAIAHRHLEQVIWSSLLAAGRSPQAPAAQWLATMDGVSEASFRAYRELLDQPDFVPLFRCVTPISEIEQLPIGSRPSRRKPDGGLQDLRAIPWVFSWTQSRCLLPAWYGIGASMKPLVDDPNSCQMLREMYSDWPFFRALVDNAELALAKSDLAIAAHYAGLAKSDPALQRISEMIATEFRLASEVVLKLTGNTELLQGTPWLQESIRVRNRFIDPLNLIQIELLRRGRAENLSEDDAEELRYLTRLSINGVAAGMRTSG